MHCRLLLVLSALIISILSCREDSLITQPDAKLAFSTKEVFFDTLFKDLSSATKRFKVFNPHNKSINIQKIQLMGGDRSNYRVNIDGNPSLQEKSITLGPKDSLFIFVEVTIDRYKPSNPFIIKDSIRFKTNGNLQYVSLKSYGRKAIIHNREVIKKKSVWRSDTPHLIVNFAAVDSNTKLTIEKGTKVFVSGGGKFFIFGNLEVNGTKSERVYFQGTRPESGFKNIPGQWHGIRILPSSQNNIINNAILTEGTVGIEVDSVSTTQNPKLTLLNSRISYMSQTGIAGFSADIFAFNTIVNECCGNLMIGSFGGNYQFLHCTFMASSCRCSPKGPALAFNNRQFQGTSFDLKIIILNSIIWGSQENELSIRSTSEDLAEGSGIAGSLIKSNQNWEGNKVNQNPEFKNVCNNNFKPANESPALNAGNGIGRFVDQIPELKTGFFGESRDTANPDVGAISRE